MASERTKLIPTVVDESIDNIEEPSRREKGLISSDRHKQPVSQLGSHSLIGVGTILLLLAIATIIVNVQVYPEEEETAMPAWCVKIPPEKRQFVPACRGDANYPPSGSLAAGSASFFKQLDVDLEGKSADKKKEKKHTKANKSNKKDSKSKQKGNRHHDHHTAEECESDARYSKHTLKTAYELPFAALFRDNKGQKKFEASSVTIVDNQVYSVCDSSWAISKFDSSLLPFSDDNVQIGSPDRDGDFESGFEAIFHHAGTFYVVRESVLRHDHDDAALPDDEEKAAGADDKHSYHAIIEELELGDKDYTVKSSCGCEFEFEGDSKGFEGALGFADAAGELYIIGLCEGNHCSESRKADAGNGRLVIMRKVVDETGVCQWISHRVVNIPKSAYFIDYSAIDIADDGRVAISSQENSEVWIGKATGIRDGIIDANAFGFNEELPDKTLQFPKSNDCHTIYCNIEGIHWMNSEMLMAVSDKMKSRGKQDFRCFDKDQSIHAFVLP